MMDIKSGITDDVFHPSLDTPKESDDNVQHTPKKLDDLPADVLYELCNYLDPINLMKTNRYLCDVFAPYYYDKIYLFLVLTKTDSERKMDMRHLQVGAEVVYDHKGVKQSLAERIMKRTLYDYEVLDTGVDNEYLKTADEHLTPRFSRLKLKRKTIIPSVIYKYDQIICILEHVIKNPNSRLRRYIRKIMVNVAIFDGFPELITNEGCSIQQKIEELRIENRSEVLITDQISNTMDITIQPKVCRCHTPLTTMPFETFESKDKSTEYQYTPYWREQILVGALYHYYYNNWRIGILQENTQERFEKVNAFSILKIKMTYIYRVSNLKEKEKLKDEHATHIQGCVRLENKSFVTKNTVETLLEDLIDLMGSNSICGNMDCSLILSGILDYKMGFTNPKALSIDLGILKPTFIMINRKPNTN
ncbi:hypothetical protein BN7_6736 [Wickerhamomyces ciferrii]|uniref:F-box domain-containing protein n=1 Tax=Wickerhamomyces ciferrii (strain ATCC 14091 / BCRC 22168 / CBS 111 / JCM 3599 / NBRC 0793 / NRRL Y-1031 F-60-10) TaxID=1206466 RepID=K0KPC7_WICCF|nr:uncharacterized protein BN7_6736 [Wickerhamomyces ciferrii]CCH47125.1 hypothetical protein BN7_6736 [Wickerhamomyces ciferrii]